VTDTPRAGADTEQLARLRTALAAERTVFVVMRSGLAVDPDHHRMVSPWVMTLLIGVVQIVVTVVVVLLIADAFEG
jgi:hypothetical protein